MSIIEKAAQKASELKGQAAQKASELKDHAAQKASELKEHAASKVNEAMEAGLNKLKETLADFESALPVVKAAGYQIGNLKIELGLSPKLIANFVVSGNVTAEQVDAIIAANADKKLAVLLVRSIFQARRLQESVRVGGLVPRGIAVEIGVLPTITVEFA
jgi:hypothetical protein